MKKASNQLTLNINYRKLGVRIKSKGKKVTQEFPLILAALRPTHGWLPFAPLIDIPKGFSS